MNNLTVDSVTGYLEHPKVTPFLKAKFLKAFLKTGDLTFSASECLLTYRDIEQQLEEDSAFKESYRLTLLEMKHKLEGMLYKKGLTDRGAKERQLWLQANFPEQYTAKKVEKKQPKKEKTKAEQLADEI